MVDKEKLFQKFLEGYLKNVQTELPQSYRASQLREGGIFAEAVYEFETRFLREPFMNALKDYELLRKD